MKVTIVEGTPEEIAAAFPHLNAQPHVIQPQASTPAGTVIAGPGERQGGFVSVEIARKVLKRIPLSKEQLQVLRAVYEAHPGRIRSTELLEVIGYSRAQFSGLMGAFGRRIAKTPGYKAGDWFWDQDWDYEVGTNRYSLPETVREALRLEKLV